MANKLVSTENNVTTEEEVINPTSSVVTVNTPEDDIIDIDLSAIKKKRFRINGDFTKMLELNVSDMNIVVRLQKALNELKTLQDEASQVAIDTDNTEEALEKMAQSLSVIDAKMRELIDFIFDSNVSEVCASDGSMYDSFNGTFRYEHIIETLTALYENNISSEYKKMQAKISKKTSKYTQKKYHN